LGFVARAFDIVPALGHDGVVIGVDVAGALLASAQLAFWRSITHS